MTETAFSEQRSIAPGLIPYFIFISLLWGGNVVSIKIGARGISPLAVATRRFLICGGAFCFVASTLLLMRYHARVSPPSPFSPLSSEFF